jgi:hypothetical protein
MNTSGELVQHHVNIHRNFHLYPKLMLELGSQSGTVEEDEDVDKEKEDQDQEHPR